MITKNITFFTLFILGIIFSLSSCGNKISQPEEIGTYVFNILNDLNNTSEEEFLNKFISIEEMRELGKNEEVVTEESSRNNLTSWKQERLEKGIINDYNNLVSRATEFEVNWDNIKYNDFTYKIREEGVKYVNGKVFFESSQKKYLVDVTALWDGQSYKIIEIGHFKEI